MKRFLNKRWHGIPLSILTAILLLCLLAGGVLAAYQVFTNTVQVGVLEPLVVTEIQAPGVGQPVYAGGEIGISQANGGKYFITNLGSQPITVTITVTESSGQMTWYGFKGCYATTGYTGSDTCNYTVPIIDSVTGWDCWSTGIGVTIKSCTFELGTVEYVWVAGFDGNTIGTDSSSAKFFVDGVVKDDADPAVPLNFIVTVTRG